MKICVGRHVFADGRTQYGLEAFVSGCLPPLSTSLLQPLDVLEHESADVGQRKHHHVQRPAAIEYGTLLEVQITEKAQQRLDVAMISLAVQYPFLPLSVPLSIFSIIIGVVREQHLADRVLSGPDGRS